MTLSDGERTAPALLPTSMTMLVTDGSLVVNQLVVLNGYTVQPAIGGGKRSAVVVVKMAPIPLEDGVTEPEKIGEPINWDSPDAVAAAAEETAAAAATKAAESPKPAAAAKTPQTDATSSRVADGSSLDVSGVSLPAASSPASDDGHERAAKLPRVSPSDVPMPDAVQDSSRVDLDLLVRTLEEDERAQAAARRAQAVDAAEAAAAEEAAAAASEPAASAFDSDSFAVLDWGQAEAGLDSAQAPAADVPNKRLDLGLVAQHLEASLPSVERVAGRKVVLLLGNTGVGKSLLLQALAGSKVVRRRHAPGSGPCPMDLSEGAAPPRADAEERWVWDVADGLEGFDVGHEQASETKCIRHYAQSDDSIVYLDAPGSAAAHLRPPPPT
jgi:hypothetical protein